MTFEKRYGPWALILGASEGTGAAFARAVAAQGVRSILIARRQAPLSALARDIRAEFGIACVTASVDLSHPDAAEKIVTAVDGREVGLLISNAGSDTQGGRFLDRPLDAWSDLVNRNVVTVMKSCHIYAGPMRDRKRGGIILVGSRACYSGASYVAVYSGTKAFDLSLAEGLWSELSPEGVDVLGLVLTRTDTPAFRALTAGKEPPPPGSLASPEDVARVGLARLPHGPVHNFALADDEAGILPMSAAQRRQRVIAINALYRGLFEED